MAARKKYSRKGAASITGVESGGRMTTSILAANVQETRSWRGIILLVLAIACFLISAAVLSFAVDGIPRSSPTFHQ
jgi:hypothetical protein